MRMLKIENVSAPSTANIGKLDNPVLIRSNRPSGTESRV